MLNEIWELVTTTEFLGGLSGTGIAGGVLTRLAVVMFGRLGELRDGIAEMKSEVVTRDETIAELRRDNDKIRDSFMTIQTLYNDKLVQTSTIQNDMSAIQNNVNNMGKLINELNAVVLEKQEKIKLYSAEVNRLQQFEKMVKERNNEIELLKAQNTELGKRITHLEHQYAIKEAEQNGALKFAQALTVKPEKDNHDGETKEKVTE